MIALTLLACGDGLPPPPNDGEPIEIGAYHGLDPENTWTWRDDGDTGEPLSDDLLKAQLDETTMVLRRGARWVDGADAGSLTWSTQGGLYLLSWEIGDASGEGTLPFAEDGSVWGGSVSQGDWRCTSNYTTSLATWYATFEDAAVFDCQGADGPEGTWAFARDYGLVWLESDDALLDLVAAW